MLGSEAKFEWDAEKETVTMTVAAPGGRIRWVAILRALAELKGYDGGVISELLPAGVLGGDDGILDLNRWSSLLMMSGFNAVMGPAVVCRLERDDQARPSALHVRLNKQALLSGKRWLKKKMRKALLAAPIFSKTAKKGFNISFDADWHKTPPDKHLVLVIHGLNSSPERFTHFLNVIRAQSLPCAVFRYPNDQPIKSSALLLAVELARVAKQYPGRKIDVVAFSMGGLIARYVVEVPELDPKNVARLITVSTPHQGSMLAHFAFAFEWYEQLQSLKDRQALEVFFAAVEDGLGEAGHDLVPGSAFLKEINSIKRNPNVTYTVFIGTGAPLSESHLGMIRSGVGFARNRNIVVRFFGDKLDGYLEDLDEVVAGKGDGAVSIRLGRLEGVKDTQLLDYSHVNMVQEAGGRSSEKLTAVILSRLTGRKMPGSSAPKAQTKFPKKNLPE